MSTPALERWSPWVLRALWVAVLWAGASAIDGATAHGTAAVHAVARSGAGAGWLAGVVAMAVPAVISLTAVRVIVPLAVPAAALSWLAGADSVDAAVFLAVAVIATVVAFGADLGRTFVQASAYGHEDRHLLRPPTAYAAAASLAWAAWAACALGGPLLLADRRWVLGVLLSVVAVAGGTWAWPRWHRLARRWFVLVPVGIVLHDHLVLGETLMLRRQEISGLRLALASTDAADLTGPASGHALEILTAEPVTAIFASTPREPRGRVIHATGCLVSPTRPGRVLRAARERKLPVG